MDRCQGCNAVIQAPAIVCKGCLARIRKVRAIRIMGDANTKLGVIKGHIELLGGRR